MIDFLVHNTTNSTRMDNFTLIGYTISLGIQNLYVHKNAYRYSFNDKENDNEMGGEATDYTATFWEYDWEIFGCTIIFFDS